jgi:hypothetical protein
MGCLGRVKYAFTQHIRFTVNSFSYICPHIQNDITLPQFPAMNWQEILDDIEDEQAILFVGPEFVRLGGQSLGQHVREQLHRQFPDQILHHYQRDGIFLFRDDDAKVKAQKQVKRLYRQLPPDEALLQRIAAIPFHLIIALTPDTFLRDTFEQCGLRTHFHYFRSGESAESLPKPERGKPLIYNLVGEINHDESLVLDYEDVFNLMKDCLSTGLPTKINAQLMRASTFVFLGFDFEKWHTQMLLRFLSQRPGISKFAIEGDRPNADTHDFLLNQFKLTFNKGVEEGETFFDSLYRKCDNAGMLRTLINRYTPAQTRLMRSAYSGKLDTALADLLKVLTDPDDRDQATLLSGRLQQLTEQQQDATIDSRDYWVEWNKIAYNIIHLIKKT